jgi:acylphosphatase
MGEASHWIRVRLQEEIHAHGLEGNVAQADDKTIVVVVEGDVRRVRGLYEDLREALPDDIEFSGLEVSKSKTPLKAVEDPSKHILDLLQRLEQRVIKIENRVNTILARLESGYTAEASGGYDAGGTGGTTEESASAFASLFGD